MKKLDYGLALTVLFLLGFGIFILSGISGVYSYRQYGTTTYFLNRQLIAIFIGLVLAFIIYKLPFKFFKKTAFPFFLLSLSSVFLTNVPILGIEIWGARRWLNLGIISIQPAELLKVAFIFYLSVWLGQKKGKTFFPFLAILFFISLGMYLQNDLSTLCVIIFTGLALYFLAGKSLKENLIIWASTALVLSLFLIGTFRIDRILALLGIDADPLGSGFQAIQALITVGSGGLWGRGFGFSIHKVPHAMSDAVFAIIAEEGGFFFSSLVLFLFFFFFWKCFLLAKKNKNKTTQLLIIGVSIWFLTQALIHVGAMIGLAPITGVPLPLISYGGSHIVAELIAIGFVFNVLKSSKK